MVPRAQEQDRDEYDLVDAAAVAEDLAKAAFTANRFAPREPGTVRLRILTPVKYKTDDGLYYKNFGLHYNCNLIGPSYQEKSALLCEQLSYSKSCLLCTARGEVKFLAGRSNPSVRQRLDQTARLLKPRPRAVMNVLHLDALERGVLTWEIGEEPHSILRGLFQDYPRLVHPKHGHDLKVTFNKKFNYVTVTGVLPSRTPTPVTYPQWIEEQHDLTAYMQRYAFDRAQLTHALENVDFEEIAPPAEYEEPQRVSRPPRDAPAATHDDALPEQWDDDGSPTEERPATQPTDSVLDSIARKAGVDHDSPDVQRLLAAMRKHGIEPKGE